MKKALKILMWFVISLLGLTALGTGLVVLFLYLITLPKSTNETSRVGNINYRVIGGEFYHGGGRHPDGFKFSNCKGVDLVLFIRRYKEGDLDKLAKVLNNLEVHERTKRNAKPIVAGLDSLMFCSSFGIFICKRNVVKPYDCSDRFFVESVRYRRINEEEFCLSSDSGKRECFDFTWTPKERNPWSR
ncbi:MAG: hypothetical protein EA411_09100 [Saprospirales bacterium]|nr:MAG: hypothetical protein EA411_09100 [Saprospirales bacterium]